MEFPKRREGGGAHSKPIVFSLQTKWGQNSQRGWPDNGCGGKDGNYDDYDDDAIGGNDGGVRM